MDDRARIAELEAENAVLKARVRELETQLALVLGKVAELEKLLGRNSSNSSKPPSSDSGAAKAGRPENANRAARRAKGRKQGKQPGVPGHTLAQVADPDVVVVHRPGWCRRCERSLEGAAVVATVRRQVFDVPDTKVVVTEHRAEKRRCGCGCETTAEFPAGATAPAAYGPQVKAHAVYLMCAQHVPRERCAQAMTEMLGVNVSTGTLDNWIREAAQALQVFIAVVAAQLQAQTVLHADETSVRSGRKALWVHVTCTALLTLLHVGRRDKATVEAGPLGDYGGTIVHDRLAMYFGYGTGHVLCNAHILRSLNELLGNPRHQAWAKAFIELIIDTKTRVDAARTVGKTELSGYQRRRIRKRWDDLCNQAARAAPAPPKGTYLYGTNKDARLLALALAEHRDLFLAYTRDLTLPFDNNQAERDLRMIKLQAKISGEFRSHTGATHFATIRSYISTNRKQAQNTHHHLRDLFTPTGAWLPTPTGT
ncbi:MAG: IS66 family transposase [Microthrixaceae bacterium]